MKNIYQAGMSMIEVMIVTLILGVFAVGMNQLLVSSNRWQSDAAATDDLALEVMKVWHFLDKDANQMLWYAPGGLPATDAAADRGGFYAPYVTIPAVANPLFRSASPALALFDRQGPEAAPFRLDQATWAASQLLTRQKIDDSMPGAHADMGARPGSVDLTDQTTYENSFFAPSQELVYVRTMPGSWNEGADLPNPVAGLPPRNMPQPSVIFRGPTATERARGLTIHDVWREPGRHQQLGVLPPSAYEPDPTSPTWRRRVVNGVEVPIPYGRVLDSCFLDQPSQGALVLAPLLEQEGNPSRLIQLPAAVRLLGYQVVSSPLGLGRLVRTYVVPNPSTVPVMGVDPGQAISMVGTNYLVVDQVISDDVVRIVFDTARHDPNLGINSLRAKVFFARVSRVSGGGDPLILRRMATMVFAMRATNAASDQVTWSALVRPGGMTIDFTTF
jgi:prepilin-type N-terminal cleavage/methylation domain-containing protein